MAMNVIERVNETNIPTVMTSAIFADLSHKSMTRRDTRMFAMAIEKSEIMDVNERKPWHTSSVSGGPDQSSIMNAVPIRMMMTRYLLRRNAVRANDDFAGQTRRTSLPNVKQKS